MAELDDRYYSLQNQKSDNEASQRQTKQAIEDIDARIKRLRQAYDDIGTAKGKVKTARKEVTKLHGELKNDWKGKNADELLGQCVDDGELKGAYDSYIQQIDAAQDAINWEIYELKTQRNRKYGFLQDLINGWNWLCTQIGNYFN